MLARSPSLLSRTSPISVNNLYWNFANQYNKSAQVLTQLVGIKWLFITMLTKHNTILCLGPSKRKDAGTGGEKQPEQWVAVHQEEIGGDWKSEGRRNGSVIVIQGSQNSNIVDIHIKSNIYLWQTVERKFLHLFIESNWLHKLEHDDWTGFLSGKEFRGNCSFENWAETTSQWAW